MTWRKLGHIFVAENHSDWMYSHAMIPVAEPLGGDMYRIYFSPRDKQNRGHGAYLDLDMRSPLKAKYLHTTPVLTPGELGTFDDSGALPNAIVKVAGRKLLYYTGINLGVTVKIRNSIGLAEWDARLKQFLRLFKGPVIDRTKDQPHFVATPEVMWEEGRFRAWFTACQKWEAGEIEAKHFYNLEYAESADGIHWDRTGKTAIDFVDQHEYALGVPRVIKENDEYKMWFCSRASKNAATYRIRYATSQDGVNWVREPGKMELDVSDTGWDSDMVCYPFIFEHGGHRYMLYNGNGYGKTGFGLAIME